MSEASLSAKDARALALRAQGFGRSWRQPVDLLDHLGAIQLDSVNVLARNHELPAFARTGQHDVASVYDAIYERKRGFEYWGHAASWLPMAEYRYFLPRMQRMRRDGRGWWARVRTEHAALYPEVLARVRDEGSLGAAHFEDPRQGRGTWWDWKPAKLVLEDLFDQGLLMCARRTAGFARLYDLPERVLPAGIDTSDPGPETAARHLLRRGVAALGVCTGPEAADVFRLKPAEWRPALHSLLESGEVVRVQVEGWKQPAFATPAALEGPFRLPRHRPVLLAPFDNLLWDRDRVERIFGFYYRVEIYVPEPKRQYGYYVLPLLARGGLRGRADLKLDRPTGTLRARRLWLEGAEPAEMASALQDLAMQLGAREVCVEGGCGAADVQSKLGEGATDGAVLSLPAQPEGPRGP